MNLFVAETVQCLFVLLEVFHVRSDAAVCPLGRTENDGYCYMWIADRKATWQDGVDLCSNAGGELVLPITAEDNSFVWGSFQKQNFSEALVHGDSGGLWLGCRRDAAGVWDCSGTSTLQFAQGKSNETSGTGEVVCTVMWRYSGKWAYTKCNRKRFVACQRRLTSCNPHRRCIMSLQDTPGCLLNHVMREIPTPNPWQCCLACSNELRCRSFNYHWRAGVCQLNIAKRSEIAYGKDLSENPACVYYEMHTKQ